MTQITQKQRYAALKDPVLRQLVADGKALDVSFYPKTADGDYILPEFLPDRQYIDAFWGAWVFSIGESLNRGYCAMQDGTIRIFPAGTILASWTTRFVQDHRFKCIYWRR